MRGVETRNRRIERIGCGRGAGMVAMDQSLGDLWRRGLISRSEALRAAFGPANLEQLLRRSA